MSATAKPLEEILESEWDATLFRGPKALAVRLGWTSYHTLRSKGSRPGYPDRTLARDRILFVETKREPKAATPVSTEQKRWLDMLARAGGEVYLWRPRDLEEAARVLSSRWIFHVPTVGRPYLSRENGMEAWTPGSLWIPGFGRDDGDPK